MAALSGTFEQVEQVKATVTNRKDLFDLLKEDFWMDGEKEAFIQLFPINERKILQAEMENGNY